MKFSYPPAPTAQVVEDLHGVPIPDPYRPLEDPHAPETRAWIEAQNRLTFDYLAQIPLREALKGQLEELWNYPRVVSFFKRGGRYFSLRNNGLQNQNVLHVQESLEAAPRVLLDPNTLSEDGTVALNNYSVSRDGRYLAYALSQSGSDWLVWKVREVESGQDLPDEIRWSKFSTAAWLPDSSGFFYSRYDPPAEGHRLHRGQLLPEGLPAPPGHAPGRRCAGLRAARPEGVGLSCLCDPRRAVRMPACVAGHPPGEPVFLPGVWLGCPFCPAGERVCGLV
ncbi:MAG: hypothetical protein KatS3mg073_0143 [Meiothermus sp.]|nr:MAG: hypothetical protein KatS3mg073_0143 [Meiothermus sp.]